MAYLVTCGGNASLFAPTKQGITILRQAGKQVYNNIFEVTRITRCIRLTCVITALVYIMLLLEMKMVKAIQTQPVLIVRWQVIFLFWIINPHKV